MASQAELISKGYHSLVPSLISILLETVWVPLISCNIIMTCSIIELWLSVFSDQTYAYLTNHVWQGRVLIGYWAVVVSLINYFLTLQTVCRIYNILPGAFDKVIFFTCLYYLAFQVQFFSCLTMKVFCLHMDLHTWNFWISMTKDLREQPL